MTDQPLLKPLATARMLMGATGASANDSVAELTPGGLVLSRSDTIEMAEERLSISTEEIRVDYRFRNRSDGDIAALIAFPLPTASGGIDQMIALPDTESGMNLLGFTVTQDGQPITPTLDWQARAMGLDISAELDTAQVPQKKI